MDVLAVMKGLLQGVDTSHVGKNSEFDLGIVGRDQHVALLRDEGFAYLAAFHCAHRDILQVWVRRREPSGRRGRLAVGGVDAACLRIDGRRQGIRVGTLEFGELAVLYDGLW